MCWVDRTQESVNEIRQWQWMLQLQPMETTQNNIKDDIYPVAPALVPGSELMAVGTNVCTRLGTNACTQLGTNVCPQLSTNACIELSTDTHTHIGTNGFT